jgi:predicted Zn-dependent protease
MTTPRRTSAMRNNKERDPRLRAAFDAALRLRDSGDLTSAIAHLRELARDWPEEPTVIGMLACLEWSARDYESASVHGRLSVRLSPQSELASQALFLSLYNLGRVDEALAEIARFRSLKQSDALEKALVEIRDAVAARLRANPFDRALLEDLRKMDAELVARPVKH